MLIDCYECKGKVSDAAASCPHCGAVPVDAQSSMSVVVSDFDMKFFSLVWFLIKLAFAAVPAAVILYSAAAVFQGFFNFLGAVVTPMFH